MVEASEATGPSGATSNQPSEQEVAGSDAPRTVADEPAARADAGDSQSGEPVAAQGEAAEETAGAAAETTEVGESAEAGGDGAGEPGTAAKRKRKRRRKRKGETESGEREAPAAGDQGEPRPRKRESAVAPFQRFFAGAHGARKHGFAVGEAVAGRVKEVANGCIAVDLFGKAIAYADEFEPRDLPPLREQSPEPQATSADAAPTEQPTVAESEQQPAAESEQQLVAEAEVAAAAVEAQSDAETASSIVDTEAAISEDDAEVEGGGETTLTGGAAHAGHGPLPPAPVVPENFPRPEPPSLGQVFRGRVGAVCESGHIALVNRDVDREAVLANLARYRDQRRRVQGLVFGFNRGGFDVLVEGVRAFCPASAMTLEDLDDPAQLLGHKLEFLLPASQSVAKDIIVSRRSILERQLRKKQKELVRSLEPGQRFKGKVTGVREFGLFVDIGGVEGLVHQSELSFAHGAKPSEVAAVGDEVEVQVLRVGGDTRKGPDAGRKDRLERVSLSIKACLPDPWDAHAQVLKEGSARAAKVTRTTEFGAFVELVPQVEGLLHITELGRDLQHANQAVKEGDEIFVVIERVDKQSRRISLSKLTQKEMEEYQAGEAAGAEPPRSMRPGSRIKVKVTRAENRGLIVRVSGVLGKRARGYVPSTELVGERGDLRKAYAPGTELEVKVIGLDRDGGLRCSAKALQVDEERNAVKDYRREAAKQGFGTFGDLLRAKLGQADSK